MSQRESGYARIAHDFYETPEWVTEALLPHLPPLNVIWEPAAGSGKMVDVLSVHGKVLSSDIASGDDFLGFQSAGQAQAIITNPPYALAKEFIDHAIDLMELQKGLVAMLLRTDFDHASSRRGLFQYCPMFAKKLVLTRRIVWFEGSKAAPSFNHAWFIWDWKHAGPPVLSYGPGSAKETRPA